MIVKITNGSGIRICRPGIGLIMNFYQVISAYERTVLGMGGRGEHNFLTGGIPVRMGSKFENLFLQELDRPGLNQVDICLRAI